MSKSLGNGIDPLEVIDKYGADALRFMLANGNSPGNDMRYSDDKVKAARNFANKLWNASRFIMMNLPEDFEIKGLPENLTLEDKWIVSKFNTLTKEVNENLEKFELGVAASKIYDFIWDIYCDWYIELTKPRIAEGGETKETAQAVLVWVMQGMLKLLHPFMPFITEEIWQALPHEGESIMISSFPVYNSDFCDKEADEKMEVIMNAIKGVRNIRNKMNVPPSKKAKLIIVTDNSPIFEDGIAFFEKLASAQEVVITADKSCVPENAVSVVVDKAEIYIPFDELVDREKEIERLKKEQSRLESEIKRVEGKLNNKGFIDKAPANVVEEEKQKGIKYSEMLSKVIESLKSFE